MKFPRTWLIRFVILLIAAIPVHGMAVLAEDGDAVGSEASADPLGRDNPRRLMIGLQSAMEVEDFRRLARYLDVPDPESESAISKARAFKLLLDENGTFVPRIEVSQAAEGSLDDGLSANEEKIAEFETGDFAIPIIATRVEQPDGKSLWLISSKIVAQIPQMTEARAEQVNKEQKLTILGAPLTSWLVMIVVGVLSFWLVYQLITVAGRLVQSLFPERYRPAFRAMARAAEAPIALYIAFVITSYLAEPLGAGIVGRSVLSRFSESIIWGSVFWLLWRWSLAGSKLLSGRLRDDGAYTQVGYVNFVSRLFRFFLLVIAGAGLLSTYGVDVTAGLAAFGVGGLVLALGLRKPAEDFFGSMSVLLDKPVRIGDQCRINGQISHVDDIGMRSTRLRTRDRTILTIPNSEFATLQIENLTLRDSFLVDQTFWIPFSAGVGGIEKTLSIVRDAVSNYPAWMSDTNPVRYYGFEENGHKIRILTRLACESRSEGYQHQENLLITILKGIEAQGIEIVAPIHHIAVESSGG